MAKTLTKKPASSRAPAVKAGATKALAIKASVGEGASKPVEWPVGVAAKAVKKPEKSVVPPKAVPAPKPVVAKPVAVAAKAAVAAPVAPVEPVIEPIAIPEPAVAKADKKGTFIMTDALETAKAYAEEAKSKFQSAYVEMNEKAKVAVEKSSKAMEELGELTKGNYEAIVESSKIAAKGVETLSQEAVEFGRKSFEKSTSTFKSFAAIKTPAEFFQLQSELLSATLDSFASEAAKSSEAMLKLAGEVSQPISNRVAIVSEKVKALAA